MHKLWAVLIYGILWLISWPSLAILYPIARLISYVLKTVLHYRQDVIRTNLQQSFPEKSGKDLLQIEKAYYHWLGQLIIESIKVIHLSSRRLQNRVSLLNPSLLTELQQKQQDFILLAGHTGNWEWSPGAICPYGFDMLGVYKPQRNKSIDYLTYLIRKKKDVLPIPMKGTLRVLLENQHHPRPRALLLLADQIPAKNDINHWNTFLKRETGWFDGPEKLAQRFNLPVLYLKMSRIKSGNYQCELIPLSDTNSSLAPGEIMNFYSHALESNINDQPPYWLWSHRRWKHARDL